MTVGAFLFNAQKVNELEKALAYSQAQLMESQTAMAELKKENERLKVLLHLAQNLQANLELDRLLFTTMQEVAKIMDVSRSTIKREWKAAKMWLLHQITN